MASILKNVTKTEKGSATIKAETMSTKQFEDAFRAVAAHSKKGELSTDSYIADIGIKLFNGKVIKGAEGEADKHGSYSAKTPVNFAKMTSTIGDEFNKNVERDAKGNEIKRSGNAGKGQKDGNTPVYVVSEYNQSTGAEYVKIEVDTVALAKCNYEDKESALMAKHNGNVEEVKAAMAGSDASRLPISIPFTNSVDGVGAANIDAFRNNVGRCATMNMILMNAEMNEQDVDTVAKEVMDKFESVITKAAAKNLPKLQDKNGKAIEGSDVKKPTEFGIKKVTLKDGKGNVYAITDASGKAITAPTAEQTAKINEWLRGIGDRVNREKSQDLGNNPAARDANNKSTPYGRLANCVKMQPYGVVPEGVGMMVVQPRITCALQPYASSINKANQACMNHEVDPFVGYKLANEIKRFDTLYNSPSGRKADEAMKAKDAIAKELKDAVKAPKQPSAQAGLGE